MPPCERGGNYTPVLYLSPTHTAYDPVLELLALLPPDPTRVPLAAIVADLGTENHHQVRELADALSVRGVRIVTGRGKDGGNVMAVARKHWALARAMAENYINVIDP